MTPAPLFDNSSPPNPIPWVEVFRERAEARAILVEAAAMDLQSAVDGLQQAAGVYGLVDETGQDAVQKMMAEAFAKVPVAGQFEADFKALADGLETISWPRSGVARSTIMANWLAKHSATERAAIKKFFKEKKQ